VGKACKTVKFDYASPELIHPFPFALIPGR